MQSSRILVFGHDPILLSTRTMILRREGFDVLTSSDLPQATRLLDQHPVDLLILCHTAHPEEQQTLLSLAHTALRDTRTLVLFAGDPGSTPSAPDPTLSILEGPHSLLSTVHGLINHTRALSTQPANHT